jgi:hypothetical protein
VIKIENGNTIRGSNNKRNVAITIKHAFIFSLLYMEIINLVSPCQRVEGSLAHNASM